jgi:hypothetical protein
MRDSGIEEPLTPNSSRLTSHSSRFTRRRGERGGKQIWGQNVMECSATCQKIIGGYIRLLYSPRAPRLRVKREDCGIYTLHAFTLHSFTLHASRLTGHPSLVTRHHLLSSNRILKLMTGRSSVDKSGRASGLVGRPAIAGSTELALNCPAEVLNFACAEPNNELEASAKNQNATTRSPSVAAPPKIRRRRE